MGEGPGPRVGTHPRWVRAAIGALMMPPPLPPMRMPLPLPVAGATSMIQSKLTNSVISDDLGHLERMSRVMCLIFRGVVSEAIGEGPTASAALPSQREVGT